ncbi:MAG: hypothetical protein ACE14L_17415 [Terriglobales bacterium]
MTTDLHEFFGPANFDLRILNFDLQHLSVGAWSAGAIKIQNSQFFLVRSRVNPWFLLRLAAGGGGDR